MTVEGSEGYAAAVVGVAGLIIVTAVWVGLLVVARTRSAVRARSMHQPSRRPAQPQPSTGEMTAGRPTV